MNILSWQKIKKIKFEFCKDGIYCLQFYLENQSIRAFFIRNGEWDKGIFAGKEKITLSDFCKYSTDQLNNSARGN